MKHTLSKLVILSIFSAALLSCGSPAGSSDDGGDGDPTIEVGVWTDLTLSANVDEGEMTDRKEFTAEVEAPGRYVVEYRNLGAGVAAGEFTWAIGLQMNSGQEAADAVDLEAGTYTVTVDNDADVALSCQFRLVLLSDSGFYIPNEGSESDPVVLTVGATHEGKVGLNASDGDYDTSWYTFTTGADGAGDYSISATKTNGSTADIYLDLYSGSFLGSTVEWGGDELTPTLEASTVYYLTLTTVGGAIRPEYDLTVTGP